MENWFERLISWWRQKDSLRKREIASNIKYKRWQREKEILLTEEEIKNEKYKIKNARIKEGLPTFAKLFLIFLFINFTAIELFTAYVTIKSFTLAYAVGMMPDFTPLVTLIGAVMGQTLTYGFYSSKSKAENVEGGIVYESAMFNLRNGIDGNDPNTPVG